VEVGLSPLEAIRAATTRAAALLGMSDIGRIERGAFADLVAVDGDPLQDVNALRTPVLVVSRGKVVATR
jgi:imidazolonepropionase-like amidohydrolase